MRVEIYNHCLDVRKLLAGKGSYTALGEYAVNACSIGCLEYNVGVIAFNRKTVHIFNVYTIIINDFEKRLKASRLVRNTNYRDVGKEGRESALGKLFLSERSVIYDETEKSEFGSIGKTERKNVDFVILENSEDLCKSAGSVLNKYS